MVESLGLNAASSLMEMQDAAASFTRLRGDGAERVPSDLFDRDIEGETEFGTTVALRCVHLLQLMPQLMLCFTTMYFLNAFYGCRALKYALKHPLTNDRAVRADIVLANSYLLTAFICVIFNS